MANELSYKKGTVPIKGSADHLGNVREVVGDDGTLEQVNNYYPFGAPFTDNATSAKNPDLQPYKYTGKELDLTHGLNTYDHGARQNYSILGVWDRVDPMCEKYYNVSPYSFCLNNPMVLKDDNGQFPKKVMALFSWILYRITQDGNPGPIIENSNAKDENLRYMYTSSYFHDGEIEVVGHINYNDDVQTALDNGELIGEYGGKAGTVITLTAPIITALGSVFGLPEIGLTVGEIGEGVSLSANAVKDISMLLNGKGITCFFEDVIFSTFGKMGGKLIRRAVPDRDLGEVVLEQIYDAKVATFQEVYDMINKRDDDER